MVCDQSSISLKPKEKFIRLGDGPDLRRMFVDDKNFLNLIRDCNDALEAGFNAAKIYSDTFNEFHQFYAENENTDLDLLKTDPHGTIRWFSF